MKKSSPHYWPAEWERQAATWISWPHNRETWPNRFERIPETFRKVIATISQFQPVQVLAGRNDVEPTARDRLAGMANVTIHDVPTNDCWIRDYGPTFVRQRVDGGLVGIDWKYNAWGGKYPPFDRDAAAAEQICRLLRCQRSLSAMYCEGGALEGNGQGTLLSTRSCLLSSSRNPGWSQEMVERELQSQLGVSRVIWLDGGGLQGDDTDGHIDQLARFVNSDTVVVATSSDPYDPNYGGLQENLRIIAKSIDADGRPLQAIQLPTPAPRFVDGVRVPESYCNFLIANSLVLVPTFRSQRTDQAAVDVLTDLFPARKVLPLDAYDLVWGLGAFHCASQQQPAIG